MNQNQKFSMRRLIAGAILGVALAFTLFRYPVLFAGTGEHDTSGFPVQKSEEEWREQLTEEQYYILREAGTERPFTGEYNDNKEPGLYVSASTGQPLFHSSSKYNSGTGWPSFYEPFDKEAIVEREDVALGMVRTEVVASLDGGHLGHVFPDGPQPTGLRYCINSDALEFIPQDEVEQYLKDWEAKKQALLSASPAVDANAPAAGQAPEAAPARKPSSGSGSKN